MTNLISNEEMEIQLNASPAPRVTPAYIDSRIASKDFTRLGETVTICSITLDNGYSVRGESACVNPANYNEAIGNKIAYENAYQKLWALFGFLLAEKQFTEKQ